jgi:hypothetical protein
MILSKAEAEFLQNPEAFDTNYAKVLKFRVNKKMAALREEIALLQNPGLVTENRNRLQSPVTLGQSQQGEEKAPLHESSMNSWWAGPDLNRRPLARKANVLTKLDDRPIVPF